MKTRMLLAVFAVLMIFAVTIVSAHSPPASDLQNITILSERQALPIFDLAVPSIRSHSDNTTDKPFYQESVLRYRGNGVRPDIVLLC